jgi:hypothetical protein
MKERKLKWENILSPEELMKKFGPSYELINMNENGEVYVSSDYFMKEAKNSAYQSFNEVHEDILVIFSSLSRDLKLFRSKKEYPDRYPFPRKNPIENLLPGN